MTASGTPPLLSLDTLIVRPTVEIDGVRYEILSPDELSVIDSQRFARWAKELEAVQKEDTEASELADLVGTVSRKVLVGVPDAVFAKLPGVALIAVTEVFTGLLLRSRMSVAGATAIAMGNRQIGEQLSPGSSASTAAVRASGWRKRLWRWFVPIPK